MAPIALRNCQLLLNTADFGGGAVYASDIEIYGSILGGNEASGKSGGAVYLREGGKSLIVNTVIYNNTASTGSAYYAESKHINPRLHDRYTTSYLLPSLFHQVQPCE